MKTIKTMIADSIAKILINAIKLKSNILKEVIDNPENIKVEASIEDGEILIKVKKKES